MSRGRQPIYYNVNTRLMLDLYRTTDGRLTLDSVGAYCLGRDTPGEMELTDVHGGRFLLTRIAGAMAVEMQRT